MDNIDEQIDTVSRSVLALTASCARCHDHKFDPIPTIDYYALAGIFHSSDLCAGVRSKMGGGGLDYYDKDMLLHIGPEPKPAPEKNQKIEEAEKAFAAARAEFEALRGKPEGNEPGADGRPKRAIARQNANKLQAELLALTDPVANGQQAAFGVRDAKAIGDTEIRIRGEAEKLGPVVPRGFLSVVQFSNPPKVNSAQSGRLELAQWLTSANNPLTPRVMANRVWQHLFSQGLVKSVDNFGLKGDVPSHPELLDHLAARFVRDGWSVKRLVRGIVLSRAYRLAADAPATNVAVDPANRLVWRHSPRRLEAEEIRDATLAAAGSLNRSRPEASAAKELRVVELRNNGPEAKRFEDAARGSRHRSVYLPLLRGLTPAALEVFDFAEQGMVTGSRDTTTVATQALYLLNDPFVQRQSLVLSQWLLEQTDLDDAGRISRAYRLTLGRAASASEIERAARYLAECEPASRELIAQAAAAAAAQKPEVVVASVDATATSAPAGSAPAKDAPKDAANGDATQQQAGAQPAAKAPTADKAAESQSSENSSLPSSNPRVAAWASFCQALLGTVEFRYVK